MTALKVIGLRKGYGGVKKIFIEILLKKNPMILLFGERDFLMQQEFI
jgi:hypothetical protein